MIWKRDRGVDQMVTYFNHPDRFARPDLLTKKEGEAIKEEIRKCRESFEYCARNYFWITDKNEHDVLFSLWPAQELILEKFYEIRERGRAAKLLILKARQLGCSTLIEAMIAHRTIFNPNVHGLIVSKTQDHAGELFRTLLHIVDYLPWWMRPSEASRKIEEGLWFENPIEQLRSQSPGINSKIMVQWANQTTGVGEGVRLSCVHGSEISEWPRTRVKQIIDGDMVHAMPEGPHVFGFLESTGKGAGTYLQTLWDASVELGERAEWYPIFLPMFFEKSRILPPENGWRPQEPEQRMRERVEEEWLHCDAVDCGTKRPVSFGGESLLQVQCPKCKVGKLVPIILTNDQLCYIENLRINREKKGLESLKELNQELCLTPEDCFQLFGYNVFPPECHQYVKETIRGEPLAKGDLDRHGNFHGVRYLADGTKCCWTEGCGQDHSFDVDSPLWIWEWPRPGCQYVVGVDVAEGLGNDADYSVAWVNRIGKISSPDVHVATYRSNTIDPASFALPVSLLGRNYNDALMSIELNKFDTTASMVRIFYQYPNLFRWKNPDADKILSTRYGWETNQQSKPRLWQAAVKWLRARLWVIKDPRFAKEMKTFNKEFDDSRKAEAATGHKDDVLMAAFIALYTSHDLDIEQDFPALTLGSHAGVIAVKEWDMTCARCGTEFEADNPQKARCTNCGSRIVGGRRKVSEPKSPIFDPSDMLLIPRGSSKFQSYDEV